MNIRGYCPKCDRNNEIDVNLKTEQTDNGEPGQEFTIAIVNFKCGKCDTSIAGSCRNTKFEDFREMAGSNPQ